MRNGADVEFLRKAREIHGDAYDYSRAAYKTCKDKVCIICPEHGEFWQAPEKHIARRQGCPICARRKREMTNLSKYGAKNVFQNLDIQRKSQNTMLRKYGVRFTAQSDVLRDKMNSTMVSRYGAKTTLESDALRQKFEQTMLCRYGVLRPMQNRDLFEKAVRTNLARYAVDHPMRCEEVVHHCFQVRLDHGTAGSSGPEDRMYEELCAVFGIDNVTRGYKDPRYPFHCDFYIRSFDWFIELNASWTHGGHFFDPDSFEDREKLRVWLEKSENSKFYECAIQTWTVRDVQKYEYALQNDLAYFVFWDNDLTDFHAWLGAYFDQSDT